jgi:hypothetical protein
MGEKRKLRYGEALALAWSLTWRLGIAGLILMLLLGGFSLALPPGPATSLFIAGALIALEFLLVWPIALKKALGAHFGTIHIGIFGNSERVEQRVGYWHSVLLGVLTDGITLLFVVLTAAVLHMAGVSMIQSHTGGLNLLSAIFRFLVVLPAGLKLTAFRDSPAPQGFEPSPDSAAA